MKKFLLFFGLLPAFLKAHAQNEIDILHYKFEIGLSDKSDSVKGKAWVTLMFTEATDKFWLRLASPNGHGKGMIAYMVLENNKALTSAHGYDSLTIYLSNPARIGETRTFEIRYSGIPYDGLIISRNKYGDKTFFADNWPDRAHDWIPCKDEPGDKASFEFLVTAPAEYRVISNGKLEEEKLLPDGRKLTHWSEEVPLSTKVMVIGVAKFAVTLYGDSPPQIPVTAWTYPQDSVTGTRNYSFAPFILKFYSGYIGPYPYNKLANVQSKTIFGGMENASAIFYYERSAEESNSTEDLLAHEIAHQWFGDMASEKSFPHLWLSEGFATYMTDVYLESKYGTDSMNNRLRQERKVATNFAEHSDKPVVDSVSPLKQLLDANSYQKGAWVLHMLRRQFGDSVFHAIIRTYYEQYKGKNADTDDFEKVAEDISHRDLHQFFKQWLYTPGIPQLNIQWQYNEKDKTVSITIQQVQKGEAFAFPLGIAIQTRTANEKIGTLNIAKKTETFSFGVADADVKIVVDPFTALLYDGTVEKITP